MSAAPDRDCLPHPRTGSPQNGELRASLARPGEPTEACHVSVQLASTFYSLPKLRRVPAALLCPLVRVSKHSPSCSYLLYSLLGRRGGDSPIHDARGCRTRHNQPDKNGIQDSTTVLCVICYYRRVRANSPTCRVCSRTSLFARPRRVRRKEEEEEEKG